MAKEGEDVDECFQLSGTYVLLLISETDLPNANSIIVASQA